MIYEFTSKATGNLIMTQAVGDQVLDLIGKRSAKGIITVLEMPLHIQRLKTELARSKNQSATPTELDSSAKNPNTDQQPMVSLGQRLVPFIEMLERAHAKEKDIVWGV